MEKGRKVCIIFNPHDINAFNTRGIVVKFRKGEGLGGCNLVDVKYQSSVDGEIHVDPINEKNLKEGE